MAKKYKSTKMLKQTIAAT